MGISFVGKQAIRDLLNNDSTSKISHFAWGTGSTAFADTDIALGSELFPSGGATQRNAVFATQAFPTENVFTGRLEDDQLNSGSLFEIGLFNSISGATMISRQNFFLNFKTSGLRIIADYYIEADRI